MFGRTLGRMSQAARLLNPAALARSIGQIKELNRSTRDLLRAVEAVRLQSEQLATVERMRWEQSDELAALPETLDLRTIGPHVRQAVASARVIEHPFPHVVVENWLPRTMHDAMVRGVPPAVFFADREESRQRLAVPFSFAPEYSHRVWRFLAHDVVRGELGAALNETFAPFVRDYVRESCPHLPADIDLSLHVSDGRIMLRRPGYVITPHRDPKWGFVTCLVYLVRPGDQEAYGTQLYRVKDDEEAPTGKPFYVDQSRCELAESVPFKANSLLAFMNSRGAHGASIPADAQPPTLERYVYQFRLGPTNKAITTLLSHMPEDRRRLWAGAKSERADYEGM